MCYPEVMSRSLPCPKCGSLTTNISIEKALYIGHPPDQIFSCYKCGKRVYGTDPVNALVAAHEAKLLELKAAADRALQAAREEEARKAQLKCAWPECPNDHTASSKYCSRTCSDKNAHSRAKARKLSAAAGRAASSS
jgi:hypothetical protein